MSELIYCVLLLRLKIMSIFSKACEYGIRAMLHISTQSRDGRRVSLKDIAAAIDSPEAFTAKILQQLARHGIVDSVKGPNGGFEIAEKNRSKIRLSHIVSAIDGDQVYRGCGLGLKECNADKPCPVHDRFKVIREELKDMLENTSMEDLTFQLKDGLTFLKR